MFDQTILEIGFESKDIGLYNCDLVVEFPRAIIFVIDPFPRDTLDSFIAKLENFFGRLDTPIFKKVFPIKAPPLSTLEVFPKEEDIAERKIDLVCIHDNLPLLDLAIEESCKLRTRDIRRIEK